MRMGTGATATPRSAGETASVALIAPYAIKLSDRIPNLRWPRCAR